MLSQNGGDKALTLYLTWRVSDTVPERAPGSWQQELARNSWRERAEAWDAWRLRTYGYRVAVLYVRALENVARKLRRELLGEEIRAVLCSGITERQIAAAAERLLNLAA